MLFAIVGIIVVCFIIVLSLIFYKKAKPEKENEQQVKGEELNEMDLTENLIGNDKDTLIMKNLN